LARARWVSQARRARSGSREGSMCSTTDATSVQSASLGVGVEEA
jgi:transposase-like protein